MKLLSQTRLSFLISTINLLLNHVSADYNSIYKTLQTFEREMFMYAPQEDNVLSDILLDISSYGCWCNFKAQNNNHQVISQAPALDQFDELCRTLHHGYNCGKIEGGKKIKKTSEVEECDPSTVSYKSGLNIEDLYMIGMFGDPVEIMKDNCRSNNKKNPCAYKACVVEGNFILKIFTIWNENDYKVNVSEDLKHGNGFERGYRCRAPNFDNDASGTNNRAKSLDNSKNKDLVADLTLQNSNKPDEEHSSNINTNLHLSPDYFCCGDYPLIQPFRQSENNARACCGVKTYNALANMCCDTSEGLKVKTVCG